MSKKNSFCMMLLLCSSLAATAQFSAGATGMHIKSGTAVFIDSLTLTPSADVTIADNRLSISYIPISGVPTGSLMRVYQWDNPLTLAGVIGIFYNNAELNGNTPANLETVYSSDMSSGFMPGSGTATTTNYVSSNFGSSVMQRITAKNAASALPLKLLSFTAITYQQTQCLLEWHTTSEENVSHFIIERSADGINFERIGKVAAHNTAGEQVYRFVDQAPASGNNFYRFVSTDFDGSYTVSEVRRVLFQDFLELKVYPNPASDIVRIEGIPEGAILVIADINGKILYRKRANTSFQNITVQHYPANTYLVLIERNGYLSTIGKLVIVR